MRTTYFAAVVSIAVAAVLLAGCGPDSATVVTTPGAGAVASQAAAAPAPVAHIGDAVTITGIEKGSKAQVTLLRVVDNGSAADDFGAPDQGKKLFGAQFRIANVGTAAYSDAPSNGAKAIDGQGQSFDASIADSITAGPSFTAQMNIAPGDSGQGFIVFEVPADAQIAKIQFGMDSGFGNQTAQWSIN
jgi:hypothetical protein